MMLLKDTPEGAAEPVVGLPMTYPAATGANEIVRFAERSPPPVRPVPVEMSVEEDAAPMFAGVIAIVVADVIRP